MENEEQFSNHPDENAKIENEFLKLKMNAQFGANFFSGANELPPEIENDFLKNTTILENSETIIFKGPFKLYMALSYGCWEMVYFVMPRFIWEN